MNLLTRIKNYFSEEVEETNLDWKVVALDFNQALIETQEKTTRSESRNLRPEAGDCCFQVQRKF